MRIPAFLVQLRFALVWTIVYGTVSASDPSDSSDELRPLPPRSNLQPVDGKSAAKVTLGKQLFFDPRLSGDNQTSCATCHIPNKAFGDGLTRALGANGKELARNTPTVLNVALHTSFFWDGRARSLEQQALEPIKARDEMHQDLDELVDELNSIEGYRRQFQLVYAKPATQEGIASALAAFQRTLMSTNSPFDRYLAGDEGALSDTAKLGLELFVGDADCVRCHHGPLLSDGKFYRLGVSSRDPGRSLVTGKKRDKFKFRTPSLRDVARTAPYMHDGSLGTLFDVIEFYFRNVPENGPNGLPLDVEPQLGLSYSDMEALVEFLKSLTGEPPETAVPKLPE